MEYLDFPRYGSVSQVISGFIVLLGLLVGLQAYFSWREIIRDLRSGAIAASDKHPKENLQLILSTIVSPLFIFVGLAFLITDNWDTYHFRNTKLNDVFTVKASRIRSERNRFPLGDVTISDKVSIDLGLKILKNCTTEVSPEKEHFTNGVSLQFQDENGSVLFELLDFRSTNVNANKRGVMPVLSTYRGLRAYSCPSFQDWVDSNITPRLDN